jgi:hypothetical protein
MLGNLLDTKPSQQLLKDFHGIQDAFPAGGLE